MRVLGIDPGSVRLGYGCIDVDGTTIACIEAGTITAPAARGTYERLAELGRDLEAVIAELRPDVVAMEKGFVAMIRGKLQQGALVSAAARGMAGYLVARAGVPVHEYPPATVKQTVTGRGNADKSRVARFVQQLLGLRKAPAADAADALAAALTYAMLQPVQERIDQAAAGAA